MAEYISKQDVIDYLNGYLHSLGYGNTDLYVNGQRGALINAIQDISAVEAADVQPISQWISVKDRLPETGESVLVYVAINKNLKGFGECKPEIRIGWLDDGDKWALQFSNMDYSEVLYWLPLPELPKDGDING